MVNKNVEILKSYLYRLLEGENLKSVKEDLSKNFEIVEPKDILKSEELLIIDGIPIEEVQKASHFYPELFSGKVENKIFKVKEKSLSKGHPFIIMRNENELLSKRFQEVKEKLKESGNFEFKEIINNFKDIKLHYEKKSDLFYTLLKKEYMYLSPSSVMWGADDEIRDIFRDLVKDKSNLQNKKERVLDFITKGEGMIFKERYILAPVCIEEFSEVDWMRIYYELDAYEYMLADTFPIWEEGEEKRDDLKTVGGKIACEIDETKEKIKSTEYITIGSGMMTPQQIDEIFKVIPMEITFVDEKNINRYYDKGKNKIFKRPDMSIGRDMFSCHPPKLLPVVRDIILAFRTGKKDSVNVWMEKDGEPVIVMYLAVRDEEGKYLGTLECVQELGFAFDRFKKIQK